MRPWMAWLVSDGACSAEYEVLQKLDIRCINECRVGQSTEGSSDPHPRLHVRLQLSASWMLISTNLLSPCHACISSSIVDESAQAATNVKPGARMTLIRPASTLHRDARLAGSHLLRLNSQSLRVTRSGQRTPSRVTRN